MPQFLVCFTVRVMVEAPDAETASDAIEVDDPDVKSTDADVVVENVETDYDQTVECE